MRTVLIVQWQRSAVIVVQFLLEGVVQRECYMSDIPDVESEISGWLLIGRLPDLL